MIQIVDMTAFVTVVQVASFTEAARRLEVTKSVVSRRIADLERELGALLLDRGARRGARPTEVGAVYYAKCVRILESIHAANDFVAGFNSLVKGRLSVVVARSFDDVLIVPLLNRFAALYPDVLLDVKVVGEANLEEMNFDVAIRPGEIDEPDLIARPIVGYRHVLCASHDYLDLRGTPVTPADLADHDGLVDGYGETGSWRFLVDGRWQEFRFRERLRTYSCSQLVSAACSGLGIVRVPDLLVADELASGRLCRLLPEYPAPTGTLSLIYPKSRRASQKVQKLLSFLIESVPTGPAAK
jgi:DNA-binding transcriptional LysR family regulator